MGPILLLMMFVVGALLRFWVGFWVTNARITQELGRMMEQTSNTLTGRNQHGTRIHIIIPGDTLSSIAKQYGVTWHELYYANARDIYDLSSRNGVVMSAWDGTLAPGQNILIPPVSKLILHESDYQPIPGTYPYQVIEEKKRQAKALERIQVVQAAKTKKQEQAAVQKLEDELRSPLSPYSNLEADLRSLATWQRQKSMQVVELRTHQHDATVWLGFTAANLFWIVEQLLVVHSALPFFLASMAGAISAAIRAGVALVDVRESTQKVSKPWISQTSSTNE